MPHQDTFQTHYYHTIYKTIEQVSSCKWVYACVCGSMERPPFLTAKALTRMSMPN